MINLCNADVTTVFERADMNSVPISSITSDRPEYQAVKLGALAAQTEDEKWNALHTHDTAVKILTRAIKDEARDNHLMGTKDLVFTEDGKVKTGEGELSFSTNGFRKLVEKLACGGASFLMKADPDVRAFALNRVISNTPNMDVKVHTRATRRQLEGGNTREIFSVTGPQFPDSAQSLELIERIASNSPAGSKAIWTYDPNKATVSYETILKLYDQDTRIGDPHRASIRWLLRDAGFGSLLPQFKVYRHKCANLMMLSHTSYELPRAIHRGAMGTINLSIQNAFQSSEKHMDTFYNAWHIASNPSAKCRRISADPSHYPDMADDEYASAVFSQLIPKYKGLKIPSVKDDALEKVYTSAFLAEPHRSFKGICNAVTHASKDRALHVAEAMQEAAGNILYDLKV